MIYFLDRMLTKGNFGKNLLSVYDINKQEAERPMRSYFFEIKLLILIEKSTIKITQKAATLIWVIGTIRFPYTIVP